MLTPNIPYLVEVDDDLRYSKGRVTLSLDSTQRLTLRRILQSCLDSGTTLSDGTQIKKPGQALQHMLELVAAAAP